MDEVLYNVVLIAAGAVSYFGLLWLWIRLWFGPFDDREFQPYRNRAYWIMIVLVVMGYGSIAYGIIEYFFF